MHYDLQRGQSCCVELGPSATIRPLMGRKWHCGIVALGNGGSFSFLG
jgi:hypothetical protein